MDGQYNLLNKQINNMKKSKYTKHVSFVQEKINEGLSSGAIAKILANKNEDLERNAVRCHINDGIKNGLYKPIKELSTDTESETNGDDYQHPHVFGKAFTDYCKERQINTEMVESAKALNHLSGPQEFNIVMKKVHTESDTIDFESILKTHIESLKSTNWNKPARKPSKGDIVGFINLNDLHLGMNPNEGGTGISGEWVEADYLKAVEDAVAGFLSLDYAEINVNIIGDIIDGQDGKTTRGRSGESSHTLPQNLSNLQQFELGAKFITNLIGALKVEFDSATIRVHALSNSNHGGDMEYFMLRLAQANILQMFGVEMDIERKSVMTYTVKDQSYGIEKDIVLMHGKDERYQKKGLPFELSASDMHDVRDLMVLMGAKNEKPILFRADLHQSKISYLRKFTDVLCPAWCPSSQHAQANYYSYDRGAVMCAFLDIKADKLFSYVTKL